MMSEFKTAITKVLTPHASAILLDPEFGLEARLARSSNAGLLLAYELSGYDNTQPGRLPDLLPHVSVKRIVDWGADAVKILIYYTPFEDRQGQRHQARVHRAHRRRVRDLRDSVLPGIRGLRSARAATRRASNTPRQAGDRQEEHGRILQAAVHVDILKVEVPINAEFVEGSAVYKGQTAYTRKEARRISARPPRSPPSRSFI